MMLVTALDPTPIAIAGNAHNNRNPRNKEIQIPFHLTTTSFGSSSRLLLHYSRQKNKRFKAPSFKASMIYDPDDFQVGKFIGSYGFMNVTRFEESYLGDSSGDIEQLRVQDVGEGNVKIRLYEGRVAQGPLRGTRVIFKVYPGQRAGGIEGDMMAANELNAHAFLQGDPEDICPNIQILLGGFETKTGEQWLAFRNDGQYSAADYAKAKSEVISKERALGEQRFWNPYEWEEKLKRRRIFVIRLLRGAINGLAYMHNRERLHQSLGPASVVLNTMAEREAPYLVTRLRDLAFSVDIRYSSLETNPSAFSEGLWRRASAAGAFSPLEKRAFGIADDIYEAGLLFAYLSFVPFCESGAMDGLSLQRLFENTFLLDLEAAREYCQADDRLLEAVKFLDLGNGAGWELLQAMLNRDYRQRPIAEAILNHRFMTGVLL
ncbi:Protein kinase domain-containing protein [Cinnamomum micranthum f. kanehirae]|uniref:Protein kinase domain-containing protein n=1 Tax=Cinnamomum micranthum f. kanehirae TaxID=337451 RepID=A0A3S3MCH1_9MAGN|nr:Protein kinase domain-containing protein [Cinnamomum micranthum f. kanehirae]